MITAQTLFAADDPALPGHFPGAPVVPGALLLDAVIAEVDAAWGEVRGVAQVKFLRPLVPGVALHIELKRASETAVDFRCTSAQALIAEGRLILQPAVP